MTDPKEGLIGQLELLRDWGVSGFSADSAWTTRANPDKESAGAGLPPSLKLRRTAGALAEAGQTGPGPGPSTGSGPLLAPAAAEVVGDAAALLASVRSDIGDCTRCKLHTLGRRQIVFGVGNPHADLMFAGEAPGSEEDLQGIPFVGRAGQLLTKIIEAMGLRRDDVYIANVVKCRPPENRNPEPDEVATCEPFLFRQIDIVAPKVIVALGTYAARTLLQTTAPISKLRGRAYEFRGVKLVPTFHPAFLLRSPQYKRDTWEDMKMVLELLGDSAQGRQ